MPSGPEMDRPLAELHAIVDRLETHIEHLADADLGDQLSEIRRVGDRLESVFAHALQRFDKSGRYADEGAVTMVSWLRWRCRLSPGGAADRLAFARNLDKLRDSDQALSRGDIGYHHAALIARTAQRAGCDRVLKEEPNLIKAAKDLDPGRFAMVTRHLRHSVDPDGALAEANQAYNRRYFDLKRSYDGYYVLDGLLDSEGGAALQTAINALSALSRNDRRFACQRRADALVELARRQLDGGGLPDVGGQRPHLTVTANLKTLQAMLGQPAGDLEWALPVPAQTVRRLACDAAATTVVLDHDGLPMGVGRTARTIPPALRRALVVRDRGCRFPSCDRPSDWTDGHHLKHWADGGETSLNNLLLLCRRHHRKVHEEGWRLAWGADGRVLAIPPPWMQARPDPLRLPEVAAIPDG